MAEQLDDFDRKDLKEFKILMTVGILAISILFGIAVSKYHSLLDYREVEFGVVKAADLNKSFLINEEI